VRPNSSPRLLLAAIRHGRAFRPRGPTLNVDSLARLSAISCLSDSEVQGTVRSR
jgi:hypothetical protein